jgi:hypothetical protein
MSENAMKNQLLFISLQLFIFLISWGQTEPLTKFSTGGNIVYQLTPGFNGTDNVIVSAAYNGEIQCFTQTGTELWATDIGEGFPFDLENGDIDLDGKDEFLVASSDGILYVFDDDGSPLWTYETEAPLYQVKTLNVNGTPYVFTGGVTKKLIMLSSSGQFLKQHNTVGAVRLIGAGNIKGTGAPYLAVGDAQRALSGNFTLRLFELPSLSLLWQKPMDYPDGGKGRFYSINVFDINKDGNDEMVFSLDHRNPEYITIFRHDGSSYNLNTSVNTRHLAYKMNLFEHISSSTLGDEYIIDLYGDMLLVRNINGSMRKELDGPYAMNACAFDSSTNTYFLGSELSGGDGIYGLHLDRPGWEDAYEKLKPVGQMNTLEANLNTLSQQVANFEKPIYQPEVEKLTVVPGEKNWGTLQNLYDPDSYENIRFSLYVTWTENYDRSSNPSPWDTKKDHRWDYSMTAAEIINKAKVFEQSGQNFSVWAGHGIDPFYMQLSTLKQILEVAPNTFQAFIFPELERTDIPMRNAVNQHIKPLADLCIEHNKKILLRNKNIFWNGTCYLDLWWDIFKDKKYRDVFVISMEETDDHLQSWSLAGRTGLWLTEHFDMVSGRAVTDNSNWLRMWEWCSTQHLSNQIRFMSLNRMYGADFFHLNFYTANEKKMIPFYQMLEKGILTKPDRHSIISLSDLAIGMKIPPDSDYEEHGTNHHVMKSYEPGEEMKVIDKMDCYWGGAPVPEYDFTRYAFNSKRRMTNFLSQAPYGNVAVIPATTDITEYSQFNNMIITDGKYWYDENNQPRTAEEYKPQILAALEEAAGRLPIRVSGEVSWVANEIAPGRIRVLLIDPGYLDPKDTDAVIHLQNLSGVTAIDILRNENLQIVNNEISLTVPMGILRIIDLISYPIASAGEDIYIDDLPVDSIMLFGAGEDDIEITSFLWDQVSGPECSIIQPDSATLILKNTPEGNYQFRITVTDNEGNTDSDEVSLKIYCSSCDTPEVDAGRNRIVRLPRDTIQLHGKILRDGRGIDSVQWKLYTGPEASLSFQNTPDAVLSNLNKGSYTFSFSATSHAGITHSDFVDIEVLQEITIPDTILQNTKPIIVDGIKEDAWCGPELKIDSLVLGYFDTWKSMHLMWNESYLYVFFEVEDKYKVKDSGDEWWQDDAVELFIDADNSKTNSFDDNDFHFGISLLDGVLYETRHNQTADIDLKSLQFDDYFHLEMAIPWSVLNHIPMENQIIGLEARVLDDFDAYFTDVIEALYGYSGSEKPTPVFFGSMVLGPECNSLNVNSELNKESARIFPSVTNGPITIITGRNDNILFIRDIYGKIYVQNRFNQSCQIDLSAYPDKIYILTLQNKTSKHSERIIKISD